MRTVLRRRLPSRALTTSVAALLGLFTYAPHASADQTWDGFGGEKTVLEGGAGIWNKTRLNWSNDGGATNTIYDPTQTSVFSLPGGTIIVGEDLTFTNLRFEANGYGIGGSANLNPTGTAILNALAGIRTVIAAPMSGTGGINLTGAGTIILNGDNKYSGGTTLSNGTLIVNSNTGLGTGTLTIAAPSTLGTLLSETTITNAISVQSDFSITTGASSLNFFLNGNIDLNGATRTITTNTASTQIQFGGTISNGSLTFATPFTAPGHYVAYIFTPTNVNNYAGLTTIGSGAFLVLEGSTANGAIQGNVLIQGNGVLDYLGDQTLPVTARAPFASEQIADNATVTVNSAGNLASGERFSGFDLFQAAGTETIGVLNGNATGTVGLANATLAVGSGNFAGVISDGFHGITGGNLTKYGVGVLVLSGANTYTGVTTINGGTLQAGALNTFSGASAVNVSAAGILDLNNFSQRIGSLAGAGIVTLGTATLTTGLDNTSTQFSGSIQGTGGLTKVGTGTMTLTGANTYTGATTVNRGTLLIDTATSANVLNAASMLTLGGGTFQLKGVAGTAQSQTMAGLTITGGSSVVSIDNNGGTSTTLDLSATGINRSGNATVDFAAASGTLGTTAIIRTGQANDATGILGAYASVNGGAALAANNGAGVIIAYTGYQDINAQGGVIPNDPTANVRINGVGGGGPVTLALPSTTINTLTHNFNIAATVDTAGGILHLGTTGGLFITPTAADLTIGIAGTAGTLTAGGAVANTPGEIVVGNFSATGAILTINSAITDNGVGAVSLTKTGGGKLVLAGVNTYTGPTTVNEGTIALNTTGGNAIGGNLVVNGGTVLLQQSEQIVDTGSVTVSAGSLNLNGNNETVGAVHLTGGSIDGATGGTPGVLTSTTNYDMQSGTVGAILGGTVGLDKSTEGTVLLNAANTYTGTTNIAGGTLRTGVSNAISVTSAVNVGANGTFDVNNTFQSVGSISGGGSIFLGNGVVSSGILFTGVLKTGSDGTSTIFSGVISGKDGSLEKVGAGTLTLSGQNIYSGPTTITAGTLQAGIANAIYKTSAVSVGFGATFDLNNFDQNVGSIADGTLGGTILLGSATLTTGNRDFDSNGQLNNTSFSGIIQGTGGLIKVGVATLTLAGANTYTGTTAIQGGAIQLSGSLAGRVTVANGSIFSVAAGGTVSLGAGVTIVDMTDQNTVQNKGSLIALANSIGINAINNNFVENDNILTVGDTSTAIKVVSNNIIFNSAASVITVGAGPGAFGIDAVSGNGIQNSGSLTVGNDATGIRVLSQNTVLNTSTLTFGDNAIGISAGSENAVTNSGTLQGGATNSQGFLVRGTNNTMVNAVGGLISATTGVLVTANSGTNRVGNLGTLTSTTNALAYDSSASTAGQFLTNAGTINGNVLFGVADDTMSISTGSTASGIINGAAGTNTLRLVGTGKDTFNLSNPNIQNFSILEKDGGSVWTLIGERAFTGGTTVKMGQLIVQGNLISNVLVQQQGILSGTGMVTGNVTNFGTVAPGTTSVGKFTINGNYRQNGNGTLVIRVAGKNPDQHDLLVVGGAAELGGTLRIERVNKAPRLKIGDKIVFLTAAGGVNGEFKRVSSPFNSEGLIQSEIVYGSNTVSLEAVQGTIANQRLDLTPNQRATSHAVDGAIAEGKNKKMVAYLNTLPLEKIPEELDRIAPEELAAAYRLGVGLASVQTQNIQRHAEDLRLTNRRVSTAGFQTVGNGPSYSGQLGAAGETGPDGKSAAQGQRPADSKWGAFLNGMGEWIRIGDTENARGYELDTAGMTAGVDYRVSQNFVVGASAGYTRTGADLTESGRLRVNGGRVGAYATYYDGGFHADAGVSGGYNNYETERQGLQGTARGQTEGAEFNAFLGGGYDFSLESLTLGALTSVEYTYLGLDDFTERGSLAPLHMPGQHGQSFRSKLGLKASYDWQLKHFLLRPEIRAIWQHEYGDRSFALDSQLASGAGGIFSVEDSAVGRDSLLLGVGTSLFWNPRTAAYLFYDGELYRKESEAHNISGGVRISF